MKKKLTRKSLSIQTILLLTFIGLLVITVSGAGLIAFSSWNASIKQEMAAASTETNRLMAEKVETLTNTQAVVNDAASTFLKNQYALLTKESFRINFFAGVLNAYSEDIYSFTYAAEQGDYWGVRRNETGETELIESNAGTGKETFYYHLNKDMTKGDFIKSEGHFDPRTLEWYQKAVQKGDSVFSSADTHFPRKGIMLTYSSPIYRENGSLAGVLGTHVLLSGLNDYLEKIVSRMDGMAVIIENGTDKLIANSVGAANYRTGKDGVLTQKLMRELQNPVVEKSCAHYQNTHETEFKLSVDGETWYARIQEYHQSGIHWKILSLVPQSTRYNKLRQNFRLTVLFASGAVLVSIFIGTGLLRRLFHPIQELVAASSAFAAGNLESRAAVVRHDEIGTLSVNFNLQADQLQQIILNLENMVHRRTEELNEANRVLLEQKNQLRLILDTTAEAIFGTDLEGRCRFCNASCLHLLGYPSEESLLGKDMHALIYHSFKDGSPRPKKQHPLTGYLKGIDPVRGKEDVLWRSDGTCFDTEYRAMSQYQNGKHVGYVVTFMDITDRKKNEEKIMFLSSHDSMTGLLNRQSFRQRSAELDLESNLPVSIFFIDLNGLKMINDIFGHFAGDELLCKAASVLKRNCRKDDIVARVGGDEFIVLLPRTPNRKAQEMAKKLQSEFARERVKVVSCSMALGIATKDTPLQNLDKVVKEAEYQMYSEKSATAKKIGSTAVKGILSALHERSPREKTHSREVSRLCGEIGLAMELSQAQIKNLKDVGYLHDIGKITLPDEILTKDAKALTEAETERMRQHPAVGYRILNLSQETLGYAASVYAHHECWDGSGYPKGLKGEEIPLQARIISVAEVYDRISGGEGHTPQSIQKALRWIKEQSGILYDPKIVEVFLKAAEKQEIG